MKRILTKVLCLLLSLLMVSAMTACGATGEQTSSNESVNKPVTLRFSTMQSTDHISYKVAANIKEQVEEQTEGRVLIDIYPSNQLGDWTQVYDELMMGSIDIGLSSCPETYDARTAVGYFPYLASTYDELGKVFAAGNYLHNMMTEIQAKQNIYFCGFFVEGIAGVATTQEIENANNFGSKNINIRSASMDCYLLPLEHMGFMTSSIPYADTFASLQTGVVNGFAGITPAVSYLNFIDLIKYYYVYLISPEVTQIMISQKTLGKLSDEDAAILKSVCTSECEKSVEYSKEEDDTYLKRMEEAGVTVVRFNEEELQAFAESVRENIWPKLAKTYGEDFISDLIDMY